MKGPRITVSTACTSSTNAIGVGLDLLQQNAADVVIAGGADALTPMMFAGFHALGVLSPEKCAPFSERYGTTLGEGAGFLILETVAGRAHVAKRRLLRCPDMACRAMLFTRPDPIRPARAWRGPSGARSTTLASTPTRLAT